MSSYCDCDHDCWKAFSEDYDRLRVRTGRVPEPVREGVRVHQALTNYEREGEDGA